MAHSLDEARAKLARAFVHLEELDREVRAFVGSHPYDVVPDFDSHPGEIVIRARALSPIEPVPLSVGVIVGDVLHNLRSTLEYLAWRLAIIGAGPDKDTHFPICDTPDKWADWGKKYVSRLRPEHAALIERLQPYHGGHRVYLLIVSRLNNTDKHSLISAVSFGTKFRPPTIEGDLRAMRIVYQDRAPMYDGAPLFRIVEAQTEPDAHVKMRMDIPYTVLFGKPTSPAEMTASKADLDRTARYIGLILRLFRDEF